MTDHEYIIVSYLLEYPETYASENVIRFIISDRSLNEWDEFVSTMKNMEIERCIEIYQEALGAQ